MEAFSTVGRQVNLLELAGEPSAVPTFLPWIEFYSAVKVPTTVNAPRTFSLLRCGIRQAYGDGFRGPAFPTETETPF